ncbi:hypothetical protein PHYSODRAFT_340864 [Phytophthora sojae]|uniref:Uncharacterized protein n=1 Tax=Phytophthora sojae (strain P6497) TaxID=1094619 RepID=G5ACY4_PHYSP|nr:hypothetical protein PHYSODRAFT_340864 [Phytophthora sojae]EGZ06646.1 hypothetical protein PHYSODRAFT_340864 [Phytophthora sojae]|eukprot:XP_009537410.1 hypothetical protein PHYSODRAFT_340864 [Phytophthora sojae]
MFSSGKIFAMCIAAVAVSSGVHAEREVAETFGLLGLGHGIGVGVPGVASVGVGPGAYGPGVVSPGASVGVPGIAGVNVGLPAVGVGGPAVSCSSGKIFAVWIAAVATLSGVHAQSGVKVAAPFVNVGVDGQPGADGRRYVDVNVMGIRVRAPLRPRGEQNYGFAGAPPGAYGAAPVMPNGYAAAPGQVIPNGYGAAPAMPAYAGAPAAAPAAAECRKLRSVE